MITSIASYLVGQYDTIKHLTEKFLNGEELSIIDRIEYYMARSRIYKEKFLKPTSNHRRERRYLTKRLASEAMVEELEERLS